MGVGVAAVVGSVVVDVEDEPPSPVVVPPSVAVVASVESTPSVVVEPLDVPGPSVSSLFPKTSVSTVSV
ncbi:MAG TPA: hypothetical protein VKA37_07715 [Halobacteriales archaeon]|nr:hypothetical protein [Halobacteriales archaeon]